MLGVVDAVDVDIDPRAALLAVPFQRQVVRVVGHHGLGQRAGEAVDVAERGATAQRGHDVDPARAGHHREGGQAGIAQPRAGVARGGADVGEADAGGWVEVDDEAVGLARLVGA